MMGDQVFEGCPPPSEVPVSARRHVLARRVRQHLDVGEAKGNGSSDPADKVAAPEGFSAFVGRVLDQLSLSAWLPAAMLVGSVAVLLQLHAEPSRNLAEAITDLTGKPLGLLIVLLFALVLATMVTQAFEFDVIRLLEGYWGHSALVGGISRLFVRRQRRGLERLTVRRENLTLRAFRGSRLIDRQLIPVDKQYIVALIEEDLGGSSSSPASGWRAKRRIREALSFDWKRFAPAELMRRLDAVETRIGEYPRAHRLMPTKLGNVLRAAEDVISTADGDELEGFVIRHWDETPDGLRREHDRYRTRLDMYCTLTIVLAVLAVLAPVLITRGARYFPVTVAVSAAYVVMSFVSYAAAVASARRYVTILQTIAGRDEQVKGNRWRRSG